MGSRGQALSGNSNRNPSTTKLYRDACVHLMELVLSGQQVSSLRRTSNHKHGFIPALPVILEFSILFFFSLGQISYGLFIV